MSWRARGWTDRVRAMTRSTLSLLLLALFACVGCGSVQGPHVRFATASASEIEAADASGQAVWYDFEAGDQVPLQMGLLGVAEAVTEQPIRMVAQRPFSIVVFPDGRTAFSFDGSSLVSARTVARWSIGLGTDGERGRAAIVLFIGQAQDVPPELQ